MPTECSECYRSGSGRPTLRSRREKNLRKRRRTSLGAIRRNFHRGIGRMILPLSQKISGLRGLAKV